jgi:hypothetical protein
MRKQRILAQGAWYEVRTAINNCEPLFQDQWRAQAPFLRVLREAKRLFTFEMRGLALEGEWLLFYIKPKGGFQLPASMQRIKQTFAERFNRRDGRTGYIWGDRYWSELLEGEPPEGAAAEAPTPSDRRRKPGGVRPRQAGKAAKTPFSSEIPFRAAFPRV